MNQLSFFNTTELVAPQLTACIIQSKKQDDLVLEAFKVKKRLTPSEVWQYLIRTGRIESNTPLTSLRRSITTLTYKGLLSNTLVKKIGIFGRPENTWMIV